MPAIKGGYIEFEMPGGRPDNSLPGGGYYPDYPSQGPVYPGRPVDPGYGWPGGGLRPGHLPAYPGRPVDPGYGLPEGGASQLPVFPAPGTPGQLPVLPPPHVDQGLPGSGGSAGQLPTLPGLQPGQLPVWPAPGGHPDNSLPPAPDNSLPPDPVPPGTVWPPQPGVPPGPALQLGYFPADAAWHYAMIVNSATPPAGGIGGTPPARPGPVDPNLPQPRR